MLDQSQANRAPAHSPWMMGYCTNVHAGANLESAQANLNRYALAVQNQVAPSEVLPVGLWLAEPAAEALQAGAEEKTSRREQLRDWLSENRLIPFTFNGFPQGDFHQAVVKHRVYLPAWDSTARRDYTLSLIEHLHALLPPGHIGSISTLPLGWGAPTWSPERLFTAAKHLREVAVALSQLEEKTGRRIVIAIEPEPGCFLDTSDDMVQFFSRYLSLPNEAERNRRYLTVCHDICHAAVMFESQQLFFDRLLQEGLSIGKVQVSSALEVRWQEMNHEQRASALSFLKQFAEDRYLHQTGIQSPSGFELVEDLPQLLARYSQHTSSSDQAIAELENCLWRIHFHVPICEVKIGQLHSTQSEIRECLQLLNSAPYRSLFPTGHLEVETYAWSVIPEDLRENDLSKSITHELLWLRNQVADLSQRT